MIETYNMVRSIFFSLLAS